MTARLEGLEELMRSIEETGKKIDRNAEAKALKAGGELLAERLRPAVPVRTGNWKDNIVVSPPSSNFKVGTAVDIGADQQGDAFYGYMYEFGTSKQSARPVYGPVFNSSKDDVQDAMSQSIKEDLGL
jgi:HK97 gp10 family phage protein